MNNRFPILSLFKLRSQQDIQLICNRPSTNIRPWDNQQHMTLWCKKSRVFTNAKSRLIQRKILSLMHKCQFHHFFPSVHLSNLIVQQLQYPCKISIWFYCLVSDICRNGHQLHLISPRCTEASKNQSKQDQSNLSMCYIAPLQTASYPSLFS